MANKFLLIVCSMTLLLQAEEQVEGEKKTRRVTAEMLAANEVLPSVVNISTMQSVTTHVNEHDPFAIMQFLLGQRERSQPSLGSGVIVDRRGLILTNSHVINRATRIIVTMADGQEYDALPLATNEDADLALLAMIDVPPDTLLQAVKFAAPDDLFLAERVVSVGNPLGYGHSVSVGVLSAKDRNLASDGRVILESLLQTDAAINPGNSGGPLVNADGELIGISVAIREGAEGISFAIPMKTIERVLCGWLLPERFRDAQLGIVPGTSFNQRARTSQAVIGEILPDSPAEAAGLKTGRVILEVNGTPVSRAIEVSRALWLLKESEEVTFTLADGETVTLAVIPVPVLSGEDLARKRLGAEVEELTPRMATALGLPYRSGLVIASLDANSSLTRSRVQRGDVLVRIGEVPVASFKHLARALQSVRHGDVVDVVIDRVDRLDHRRRLLNRYLVRVAF